MPKYEVGDDHEWADEKEQTDDGRPVIEVKRHVIRIDDNRDAHGYEYGLEWMFNVEDGVVTGYYRGHYLEGRTQSDPMRSPAWEDVPTVIKDRLRTELNLEDRADIPTDLPDHYGKELRTDGGRPDAESGSGTLHSALEQLAEGSTSHTTVECADPDCDRPLVIEKGRQDEEVAHYATCEVPE